MSDIAETRKERKKGTGVTGGGEGIGKKKGDRVRMRMPGWWNWNTKNDGSWGGFLSFVYSCKKMEARVPLPLSLSLSLSLSRLALSGLILLSIGIFLSRAD
jgi:hypothetical protein